MTRRSSHWLVQGRVLVRIMLSLNYMVEGLVPVNNKGRGMLKNDAKGLQAQV